MYVRTNLRFKGKELVESQRYVFCFLLMVQKHKKDHCSFKFNQESKIEFIILFSGLILKLYLVRVTRFPVLW